MSPRLFIFCVVASLQAIATDRESLPSPKKHCAASIHQTFSVRPNLSPDPNRKAGGFRREEKEIATFSENETADVLSRAGFSVELLENVPGANVTAELELDDVIATKIIAIQIYLLQMTLLKFTHPFRTTLIQ
ncbi:MAG: hypothetical protein R3A80_03840 [Bdellovibrionota bacterium]